MNTAGHKLILTIICAAGGFMVLLVTKPAENLTAFPAKLPLRPGLSPWERLSLDWDHTNLNQAVLIYGELTGREVFMPASTRILHAIDDCLGGRLSRYGLLARPALARAGVQVHGDGVFRVSEVKQECETLFASVDLQPVPEGRDHFRLVKISSHGH
jgi:hypothetical protein